MNLMLAECNYYVILLFFIFINLNNGDIVPPDTSNSIDNIDIYGELKIFFAIEEPIIKAKGVIYLIFQKQTLYLHRITLSQHYHTSERTMIRIRRKNAVQI